GSVLLASFEPRRDRTPNRPALRSEANPTMPSSRHFKSQPARDPKTLRAPAPRRPSSSIRHIGTTGTTVRKLLRVVATSTGSAIHVTSQLIAPAAGTSAAGLLPAKKWRFTAVDSLDVEDGESDEHHQRKG
ncbi:MAG TPA: hypothetical protein VGV93_01175, partial [Acidimicrobiales bacterium]|nr:hypothetical protein [Acidimicrobiales bacterium]